MHSSVAMAAVFKARLARRLGLVLHLEEQSAGALGEAGAGLLGYDGVGAGDGAEDAPQLFLGRGVQDGTGDLLLRRLPLVSCIEDRSRLFTIS